MAKSYYNRVPSGQVGTGEAFILPESDALNNLMQNIKDNRRMGLLNIQARRAADAQTNKDFMANQLKAKSGILYQDELNKATQDWIEQGKQYRMAGFNPFSPDSTDPSQIQASNDFIQKKAQIEGMAETRDLYQKNFLDQQGEYQKGGIDEDSWKAFNDFYKTHKLSDLHHAGVTPPTLTKEIDPLEVIKKLPASEETHNVIKNGVNTEYTLPVEQDNRKNIETAISAVPALERSVNKVAGIKNPTQLPAGEFLGSTDPEKVRNYITQYALSPAGAKDTVKAFLSVYGGIPENVATSPQFKDYVEALTKKQLTAESKREQVINDWTDIKNGETHVKNVSKFDDGEYEAILRRRREARAAEANSRARTEFSQKQEDRLSGASYNVPGNVATPKAPGQSGTVGSVTVPLEIDAGDIKGAVVPKEVFNTETGHFGANTNARNITNAKVRLMPFAIENVGGKESKRMLTDDEVKSGKHNVQYKYMVYGTESKDEPVYETDKKTGDKVQVTDTNGKVITEKKTVPVAFDASNLSDDKFEKKINFDKYEVGLAPEIQVKLIYDRIQKKYPDLPVQQKKELATEYYNQRLKTQQ